MHFFVTLQRTGLQSILTSVPVAHGDAAASKLLQESATRLSTQVDYCARALAKRYTQARASGLCARLCAEINMGSGKAGGELGKLLKGEAQSVAEELGEGWEQVEADVVEGGGGGVGKEGSKGRGHTLVDLDKEQLGKEVILNAVLTLHLRTLVEAVRVQTLPTEAYHQVVVHVHTLRVSLKGQVKVILPPPQECSRTLACRETILASKPAQLYTPVIPFHALLVLPRGP